MASSSNNNLAIPGPMLPIEGLLTVDHCGSQALTLSGHRPISVLSQPARNGDLLKRVPSADFFFGEGNICNKKGTCHETCHLDPFRHTNCLQNHDHWTIGQPLCERSGSWIHLGNIFCQNCHSARLDQPVMQDGMPTNSMECAEQNRRTCCFMFFYYHKLFCAVVAYLMLGFGWTHAICGF